jgi:hypothetical protein
VKEDFFLPPSEYAVSYKLFFSQFIKTQLAPALKGAVKVKKLSSELCAVAERLATLILHSLHAHGDQLKRFRFVPFSVVTFLVEKNEQH